MNLKLCLEYQDKYYKIKDLIISNNICLDVNRINKIMSKSILGSWQFLLNFCLLTVMSI